MVTQFRWGKNAPSDFNTIIMEPWINIQAAADEGSVVSRDTIKENDFDFKWNTNETKLSKSIVNYSIVWLSYSVLGKCMLE